MDQLLTLTGRGRRLPQRGRQRRPGGNPKGCKNGENRQADDPKNLAVHEEFRRPRGDLGHLLAKRKDFFYDQIAVGECPTNAYIFRPARLCRIPNTEFVTARSTFPIASSSNDDASQRDAGS
jgi:hypothetical protein